MLQLPPPLEPQSFLDRHWQKRPLFMPGGLPRMEPLIGADDLAWLATQPDVEARLVITDKGAQGARYRVQQGPFSERRLSRLPAENWTLLVHDVEKHLPDFRVYYDAAKLVPDWRVDDLMISVAAPGGSAGPHRDQYDVFLCQASGTREWRIAEPQAAVPARRRSALALLEPFETAAPLIARPADVLYLPPGVPHWGIAADTCTTYSLGMRAPARGELRDALRPAGERASLHAHDGPDPLYADPDLATGESEPGMIAVEALERAGRLLAPEPSGDAADVEALARAFGVVVTTPKAWLAPERPDDGEIETLARRIMRADYTRVHGMARLAWCVPCGAVALVFVNGRRRSASPRLLVEFRQLCAERGLPAARCADLSKDAAGVDFLSWLIASGTFDLVDVEM